ncbi:MAG: cyclophilin family peptidyl-prolyl cis-trans isomerase/HEAT repeat protein [Planctomycetota bacterium]
MLAAEMSRDASRLVEYLDPAAAEDLRLQAIVALGRIGDDGTGTGLLAKLLTTEVTHIDAVLWAAGLAHAKSLAEPLTVQLRRHAAAEQWAHAANAARALGWTGSEECAETLLEYTAHPDPRVSAASLVGLARLRLGERRMLLSASEPTSPRHPLVQAASELATWNMAGSYATQAKADNPEWDGDAEIALRFLPRLDEDRVERRLGAIRVLGVLMPGYIDPAGPFARVTRLVEDPEPRVVQEAVQRILGSRTGTEGVLIAALDHPSAVVRMLAANALDDRDDGVVVRALQQRWIAEQDPGVRERLAVALVRSGDESAWMELAERSDRPADSALVQSTYAEGLLRSNRPDSLGSLLQWADPEAARPSHLSPATWMFLLGELAGRTHPELERWTQGFLDDPVALDPMERPFVVSSAVALVASNKMHGLAPRLRDLWGRSSKPADEELRRAMMTAFADLAADEACPENDRILWIAAVKEALVADPSAWVRLAARSAAAKLGLAGGSAPDAKGTNDWKGLPRATEPMAAVDPPGNNAWLDEAQILTIADWIATHDPRLVFETTRGSFTVALAPRDAPVHCVSLFNAVRNGVYTNTRWHRVVPSFVVQGGDPHGHGAGHGGWTVPDEINLLPYVRGALGMPKSVKDDGGCQLFVMLSDYHPLDERYTCYGRVVDGMEVVDQIRVGDRITTAYVKVPVAGTSSPRSQ